MRRFLLCISALALVLPGCAAETQPLQRYSITFAGKLDTLVNFTVWCPSQAVFDSAAALVEQELNRYDALFDYYAPDSTLSRINQSSEPTDAPEIAALIEYCRDRQAHFGGVNIAMGAALSLWHTARETGRLPEEGDLRQAMEHASMEDVHTDGGLVWCTDEELRLDLGAVAKGAAAQAIATRLQEQGVRIFLLDCGTSSLVCSGTPPDKEGWQVALRNPDASLNLSGTEDPPETLGVLSVTDGCLGVSGDYQKYFEVNGTYYSHILSPDTGRPVSHYRMVCVLADNAVDADFFSTALFVLPPEEAQQAAEAAGVQALWVRPGGQLLKTGGFPDWQPW